MKNFLFFLAFCLTSFISAAQERMEDVVKVGTTLMYRIDLSSKSYDMRVTVKNLKPFIFDYEIIDSANAKGTITHTLAAMADGIILHNNFTIGNKTLDEKTTSLWLSKKVFKNLSGHKRKPITVFLGGLWREPTNIGFADGENDFMIRINGRQTTIRQEYARPKIKFNRGYQTTGNEFFTYYNSSRLPIILKMRTTFYIELLDIVNN